MSSSRKLVLGVLGLVAVPVVLTCVNPAWLFPPPGIDSWIYLGFFRNFPEFQAEAFRKTYYGSRLSWVLPGHFVHQLLPPLAANCALHLGVHLLAVMSLFEALRHTTSKRAAFLTALFMAGHPQFLSSVGWDYVDGVGTAYYLLAWALVVRAARTSSPGPWLFGAGVGAIAAFYSNLYWLPMLGLYLPGYAVLRRRWHGKPTVTDIRNQVVQMFAGAVALTLLLGLANWCAGGSFLFYRPSINFALSSLGKKNPWAIPTSAWLPHASWLIWPACAMVGSVVHLLLRRYRPADGPAVPSGWWSVNFLLVALLFVAEALSGHPVLQLCYYTSHVMGPMMLACGTLLAAPLARLSRAAFCAAAGMVVGAAALHAAEISSLVKVEAGLPGDVGVVFNPLVSALALTLAGFVWLGFQVRGQVGVLVAIALLAIGFTQMPPSYEMVLKGLGWELSTQYRQLTNDRVGMYCRVAESGRLIEKVADVRRAEMGRHKIWFWYDMDEPLGWQHMSLTSLWLWSNSMINDDFPTWDPSIAERTELGDLVVVPSQRPDAVAKAVDGWQDAKRGLRLLDVRTVGEGDWESTLAIFVVDNRTDLQNEARVSHSAIGRAWTVAPDETEARGTNLE